MRNEPDAAFPFYITPSAGVAAPAILNRPLS